KRNSGCATNTPRASSASPSPASWRIITDRQRGRGAAAAAPARTFMIQPSIIQDVVRNYADRGQFRRLSEQRNGRAYAFTWLNDKTMTLIWEPRSGTLQFRDVLPGVAPRSQ